MFVKIPLKLFTDTIAFLDSTLSRKVLLDELNMSHQWLYNLHNQGNDCVKLKKDKWQIIKALALDAATKQKQTVEALKDF